MSIRFGTKEYLTASEVATQVGVSVQTIHRWDKLKLLKARRHPVNGYRLYEQSDVRRLLGKLK